MRISDKRRFAGLAGGLHLGHACRIGGELEMTAAIANRKESSRLWQTDQEASAAYRSIGVGRSRSRRRSG